MSIHGGNYHGFYVSEGKLFAWGWNYKCAISSDLSDGPIDHPTEIVIPGNPRIIKFTNGVSNYTTVVLTEKGLYAQGYGGHYHFGDGHEDVRESLKPIEFYKNKEVRNYFVEGWGLWVVVGNHKVFRSGSNDSGKLSKSVRKSPYESLQSLEIPEELDMSFLFSLKEKVIDIKGTEHTLLLTDYGRVYSCGRGDYGETGMGSTKKRNEVFEQVKFKEEKMGVEQIAVGYYHSLFITRTLVAHSCGHGKYGQLGHGNTNDVHVPTLIKVLLNQRIKKVAGGTSFSLFLTCLGTVFACGRNESFQLGIKVGMLSKSMGNKQVLIPWKVWTPAVKIVDIAATWYSSLFVSSKGHVYSCGKNNDGQCGIECTKRVVESLTKFATITLEIVETSLFTGIPKKLVDVIVHIV